MKTHVSILLDTLVDVSVFEMYELAVRLYFISDRFVAPPPALQGPMDQFEQQAPPQQSFEPAGLSQGQCWVLPGRFGGGTLVG